jgi:hypothetical protein
VNIRTTSELWVLSLFGSLPVSVPVLWLRLLLFLVLCGHSTGEARAPSGGSTPAAVRVAGAPLFLIDSFVWRIRADLWHEEFQLHAIYSFYKFHYSSGSADS